MNPSAINYEPMPESGARPETYPNQMADQTEWARVYSLKHDDIDGLDIGLWSGRWSGFSYAGGTFTLTDDADNYIVVNRANGTPTISTSTTNWNDTANYARAFILTTLDGAITVIDDYRAGAAGIHGSGGAAGSLSTEFRGLTFTSDTDSTADSDPGNGLMKWNNATQASATVLYFDNQTADAVSLTTLWGNLAATGFIHLQQADDATKWQLWRWTAAPVDGTGYRKFTATLQASGGSIADAKTVYCTFTNDRTSATAGRHLVYVAAAAMRPSVAGGCASLAAVASGSNLPDIVTLDFDASTQEYAQFSVAMPKSWNEGTITFKPIWSHPATTTNFGVVWDLQAVAVSNDDTIGASFGTAQTSTDTGGTTDDLYVGPESLAITVGGSPAAEDQVYFRVSRVTGDGGDTMAVDARLHGIQLFITTDADTDA